MPTATPSATDLDQLIADLTVEIEAIEELEIEAATLDEESLSGVTQSCLTACECPTEGLASV